jgi:hypothetical protein
MPVKGASPGFDPDDGVDFCGAACSIGSTITIESLPAPSTGAAASSRHSARPAFPAAPSASQTMTPGA